MVIYIVVSPGPLILGAYSSSSPAHVHARVITGAGVVAVELQDRLPPEIRDDVYDWDEDDVTPVEDTSPTRRLRIKPQPLTDNE